MAELQPIPISPPPGVVITQSQLAAAGRWTNTDKIRFVHGKPQKDGGWVQAVSTPTSGTPRRIHAWRDLKFNNYMAAGTYRKLYVYDSGWSQVDITPIRSSGTLGTNPFTTTNGSTSVQVTNAAHGLNAGDTAIFAGATTFNGVTLNGSFVVQTVMDVNDYTITAPTTASSSGTGGGSSVTFQYEIPVGVELGTFGYGYGVGGFGLGTFGTSRTSSTIFIEPRVWSLDHFGQLLVAAYNTGSIYLFDPTQAEPWPRAALISTDPALPTNCRFAFVTQERYVFALCDGMNVQWCDQGNYPVWTPATTNTANTRTLAVGTKLIAGIVLGPQLAMVFSDAAAYVFQYTGPPFIYSSWIVGVDCGLLSPASVISVGGVAYWMGQNNFWMYNGSIVPIPNVEDIRKYVFDNINVNSPFQANATYNPIYNEIIWHITTGNNSNPNIYVRFHLNPEDQCWSFGTNTRTSGTHFTQGDNRPYFGDANGYIYQHENTFDNAGVALPYTLTLAPFAMDAGLAEVEVQSILWDFFQQSGTITVTINTYDRMTDAAPMDTETDLVVSATNGLTDCRVSGRYIQLTISDNELGSYMRWGAPVAYVRKTARRP